jgi:hypothetical protein
MSLSMSERGIAHIAFGPSARVSAALRKIRPGHVAAAVAVGLAIGVLDALVFAHEMLMEGSWEFPLLMVLTPGLALAAYVPLFVASEAIAQAPPRRWIGYAVAIAMGALLANACSKYVVPMVVKIPASVSEEIPLNPATWLSGATHFAHSCLILGLITFIFVQRRDANRNLAALRATQLAHANVRRSVLELELQAQQAKVEPQFLFDTLEEVEKSYLAEPGRGQRMLDSLIAFLRSALPPLQESRPTVLVETGLARAYLDIVLLRHGVRPRLDIDIAKGAETARLPSMTMLPLIGELLGPGADAVANAHTIGIASTIDGDRLHLELSIDSGVSVPAGADGLGALRERLAHIYGDATRLTIARHAADSRITLEIPHESADRADRRG